MSSYYGVFANLYAPFQLVFIRKKSYSGKIKQIQDSELLSKYMFYFELYICIPQLSILE